MNKATTIVLIAAGTVGILLGIVHLAIDNMATGSLWLGVGAADWLIAGLNHRVGKLEKEND